MSYDISRNEASYNAEQMEKDYIVEESLQSGKEFFPRAPHELDRQIADRFRRTGCDFLFKPGTTGIDQVLEDIFRKIGYGLSVDFLLEKGGSFSRVPCGKDHLLEDTVRAIERYISHHQYSGPTNFLFAPVHFLLTQGASFSRVPSGIDRLLEDTFRQFRSETAVISHINLIDFLLAHGASFSRIPSGLNKLLEDLFRNKQYFYGIILLVQEGASFARVPCGLDKLLEDTFREEGPGEYVNYLLQQGAIFSKVPCGLHKLLEDTFRDYGCCTSINYLLHQGASFTLVPCGLHKLLEDTFRDYGCCTSINYLLQQGASFALVPCGLDQLLEDVFRQLGCSSNARSLLEHMQTFTRMPPEKAQLLRTELYKSWNNTSVDYLLRQGASFFRVPCGIDNLLEDMFCWLGCSPAVDILVKHGASFSRVPCGLDKLLEFTFLRNGPSFPVRFLLHQDAFQQIPCGFAKVIEERFARNTPTASVDALLRQAPVQTLLQIAQLVRTFWTTTKVQTTIAWEEDGIAWPKFSDSGPVMFLSTSISQLKRKFPDEIIIMTVGEAVMRSEKMELISGLKETMATTESNEMTAITASKSLLSFQSPYFKALFHSGFKESGQLVYTVQEPYKTMRFVISYGEIEPHKVNWSPFYPSTDLDCTADNLDDLLDIIRLADMFGMEQLHKDAQRQIVIHGTRFIWPENAGKVQGIAEKMNGKLLSSYCAIFLILNDLV